MAEEERGNEVAGAVALGEEEGGPGGEEGASADGSAYNPENPYHVRTKALPDPPPMNIQIGLRSARAQQKTKTSFTIFSFNHKSMKAPTRI